MVCGIGSSSVNARLNPPVEQNRAWKKINRPFARSKIKPAHRFARGGEHVWQDKSCLGISTTHYTAKLAWKTCCVRLDKLYHTGHQSPHEPLQVGPILQCNRSEIVGFCFANIWSRVRRAVPYTLVVSWRMHSGVRWIARHTLLCVFAVKDYRR